MTWVTETSSIKTYAFSTCGQLASLPESGALSIYEPAWRQELAPERAIHKADILGNALIILSLPACFKFVLMIGRAHIGRCHSLSAESAYDRPSTHANSLSAESAYGGLSTHRPRRSLSGSSTHDRPSTHRPRRSLCVSSTYDGPSTQRPLPLALC